MLTGAPDPTAPSERLIVTKDFFAELSLYDAGLRAWIQAASACLSVPK